MAKRGNQVLVRPGCSLSVLLLVYNSKSILTLFGARFKIIFSMNNNVIYLTWGYFSPMSFYNIHFFQSSTEIQTNLISTRSMVEMTVECQMQFT